MKRFPPILAGLVSLWFCAVPARGETSATYNCQENTTSFAPTDDTVPGRCGLQFSVTVSNPSLARPAFMGTWLSTNCATQMADASAFIGDCITHDGAISVVDSGLRQSSDPMSPIISNGAIYYCYCPYGLNPTANPIPEAPPLTQGLAGAGVPTASVGPAAPALNPYPTAGPSLGAPGLGPIPATAGAGLGGGVGVTNPSPTPTPGM